MEWSLYVKNPITCNYLQSTYQHHVVATLKNSLIRCCYLVLMLCPLLQFDIVHYHVHGLERRTAKSTNSVSVFNEKHTRFRHHITKTFETFTMIDVHKWFYAIIFNISKITGSCITHCICFTNHKSDLSDTMQKKSKYTFESES